MLNERTPGVYKLLGRLEDVAYSNDFMFGHQNAGHIGVSITNCDGTESDIKNLVESVKGNDEAKTTEVVKSYVEALVGEEA